MGGWSSGRSSRVFRSVFARARTLYGCSILSRESEVMKRPEDTFRRYLRRPTRRRLAQVVQAWHSQVWAIALRATGNREDAEDITQDVFLDLLLRPPGLGEVRSAKGYLAWRVLGKVTNLRRSAERRKARERRGRVLAAEDGHCEEDIESLYAAVESLPTECRQVVKLRYFAGLRNRDIAEVFSYLTALPLTIRGSSGRDW